MDWNDLKFFLAVAETKSLSAAARQLNVSVSTVSRRLSAMEDALAVKLFRHHRDGYDLTDAGTNLLPTAESAAAQMSMLERTATEREDNLAGDVRLDAPELLGQHILLPNLVTLAATWPDIRLDIFSSVRPVRLAAQESDIVLRLVRPERGNYKIRAVGKIGCGLYCSPDFLAQYGRPVTQSDLSRFRIIGWSSDLRYLTMARWLEDICPDMKPALRLNSFGAQLVAAQNGLGIAVLPHFAARQAGLTDVLENGPGLTLDLWMLVQEQSARLPRIQAVSDYLHKLLQDNADLLATGRPGPP